MDNHFNLLKREISKTIRDFSVSFENLDSNVKIESYRDQTTVISIQREFILLKGSNSEIFRIFVESPTSGKYSTVGWVLKDNISSCMICATNFVDSNNLGHCFACGNIICNKCSMNDYIVEFLESLGSVKVCMGCCWGQVTDSSTHFSCFDLNIN